MKTWFKIGGLEVRYPLQSKNWKMSELSEGFAEHRKEVQERKASRRATETETLLSLREDGFEIKQLTEYHFRVNGFLDIFPTSKKWHNVKTNRRGRYNDVLDFVCTVFTPEI